MTANEIRQQFLDFFRSKGHEIVPSAPIVVKNDPTLMFTNAGMNQFKDYFLGNKKPLQARVADTQKCLRVSGKHNDLEEVGVDTYHHTMFEMLGNWSFGDYFKKEAVAWSWELLTEVYKLDSDRLYVTIFEGDEKEGLPRDEEAYAEWKKVIAEDRILLGNKKDNFWEMGDTGPCGPCTEIHVDCRTDDERKAVEGKTLVNNDHPQVIEIWNNVFIQFNRKKDGSLEPLPAKHVDTGMGFERLVRVLQGKTSNYDTDVFTGTIAATEKITGKKYDYSDTKEAVAFRVIADHIRAISFTIADGQLPSNTGAGYVIRRILRRAARYYYSYLDYKQPLLHQLVVELDKQFKHVFTELYEQSEFISKIIKEEEESFLRTLEKGLKKFDVFGERSMNDHFETYLTLEEQNFQEDILATDKWDKVTGRFAFELYDTYGFPFDLTRLIAKERNYDINEYYFEQSMLQQKNRSRVAAIIDTEDWVILKEGINKFIGYNTREKRTDILKYRKVKFKGKDSYQLVLEETPFYPESGGQVGDTGEIVIGQERIIVTNTKRENDLILHFTDNLPLSLTTHVLALVDEKKRKGISLNHTATHLLHQALRQILGNHVAQRGSLVNDKHLRFDFSHLTKMTDEEIAEVEELVNKKIRENISVDPKEMAKEEALKRGAMALFGEKYGDIVRVVTIGQYSVELCGGTHVKSTGELNIFKITSESAVAAGIRRIEAVCGKMAEEYFNQQLGLFKLVRESLKNPKDIAKAIEDLINDRHDLQKTKEQLEKLQAQSTLDRLILKKETINSIQLYHDIILNVDAGVLKRIYQDLEIKESEGNAVAVLISTKDGKVNVLLGCSQNFKGFDCNKIVKEKIAELIQGGGGGQKFMAMASGTDGGKFDSIFKLIKEEILKTPL